MKGRPRQSDEQKKALGTFRKDRSNPNPPQSKLEADLKPVLSLDSYGKKIWERTFKFLKENNMMGDVDVDMLTVYCNEMSKYIDLSRKMAKAEKDIEKERKRLEAEGALPVEIAIAIQQMPSPYAYIKLSHESMEKALKISDRYGFTPASRQKLKAEKAAEDTDPILAMMRPEFRNSIIAKA